MRDEEIHGFFTGDYARVVGVVTLVCGHRDWAEDAVQDAIVDVWSRRRSPDHLVAWVTTAALNRVRSRARTAGAETRAVRRLSARPADAVRAHGPDLDARLADAVAALPRAQREVVALHYLLDLSVVDIAAWRRSAEGTVKTHLHRGRHALREALRDHPEKEEMRNG